MRLRRKNIKVFVTAMAVGLATVSAANAGTTTYKYDALGRVIQVDYPDGARITYAYDAAGNRTRVVSTASPPSSATVKVVVLPLLGGVIIPVN
jgi:YD repeat-containing protein